MTRSSGHTQKIPYEPLQKRMMRWESIALLTLFSSAVILMTSSSLALTIMTLWSAGAVLWISSKPSNGGTGTPVALRYTLSLTAVVFLFNAILYPPSGRTLFTFDHPPFPPVYITCGSLLAAFKNALKLFSITMMFWLFTFTPDSDALFFALRKHSSTIPLMVLSSFYLIPRVRDDAESILEVQRIRGVVKDRGFLRALKSRASLVIPLLRDSFLRCDVLAESLESRGLFKLGLPRGEGGHPSRRMLLFAIAGSVSIILLPYALSSLTGFGISPAVPPVLQGLAYILFTLYFLRGVVD